MSDKMKEAEKRGHTTVYLVSSGDYSDYHVWCVFLFEHDAEAYIEAYKENGDYSFNEPRVEEREMWFLPPIVKKGKPLYDEHEPEAVTLDHEGRNMQY